MEIDGEKEIKITIPLRHANIYSFGLFAVCILFFGALFCLAYSWSEFVEGWRSFLLNYGILLITVVTGMAAHEFLHAVTWAAFCKEGFRSVRFGVKWTQLAPYVHCREFLSLRHYVIGCMMPGLLLGFLPLIVALCTGSGWLLCFGTFFTAGAAGDFVSVAKLRRFRKTDIVLDDPDDLGFIIRTKAQ